MMSSAEANKQKSETEKKENRVLWKRFQQLDPRFYTNNKIIFKYFDRLKISVCICKPSMYWYELFILPLVG